VDEKIATRMHELTPLMTLSTYVKNFVNFGSVTLEFCGRFCVGLSGLVLSHIVIIGQWLVKIPYIFLVVLYRNIHVDPNSKTNNVVQFSFSDLYQASIACRPIYVIDATA